MYFVTRNRNIIHALAERGHNVTAISPDAEKSPPSGVHYMQIDGLYGDSYKSLVKSLQQDPVNPLLQLLPIFKSFEVFCKGKDASHGYILSKTNLFILLFHSE